MERRLNCEDNIQKNTSSGLSTGWFHKFVSTRASLGVRIKLKEEQRTEGKLNDDEQQANR